MKKCGSCKTLKPLSDFNRCLSKIDGLQASCKKCHLDRSRTPDGKRRMRKSKLKTVYGLTYEEYNQMVLDQNNLCLVCEENPPTCVDHCHETNKVRGLLCSPCNKGLGFFKDNSKALTNAIKYLKRAD